MAGSISLSLSQQFDSLGEPLNGGKLYFYAAGTTTPQSAYQDSSLTLPWPNPIILDSAGRIPPFYLADGQIKIRIEDVHGVTQVAADNLLVVGASSGSGSAPSVDATTILATGDFKLRYGTGALAGFVRANGRSIGSASSGGTERANADCQNLFQYLWAADTSLAVSTGRGASAAADWAANKNIVLPDWRSRTIVGMGDMGSTDVGILTAAFYGNSPLVLGNSGGAQAVTLAVNQIPAGVPSSNAGAIALSVNSTVADIGRGLIGVQGGSGGQGIGTASGITSTGTIAIGAAAVTSTNAGIQSVGLVQPSRTLTIYLKL